MVPLMFGLCIEVYLVGHFVLPNDTLSFLVAAVLFIVLTGLWFAFPYLLRSRGS
jgi:hypothetical protein